MDAKLTPEQAIDYILSDSHYCSVTHDREMRQQIASLLESLAREAALGRAAVEIFEDEMYPCTDCRRDGFNEKCLGSCEWIKFCRLRAGKEAEE
jgi:hypothetical protein